MVTKKEIKETYHALDNLERRKVFTLERRAEHLALRIANSKHDLNYDKAELAAIRWALDFIMECQ